MILLYLSIALFIALLWLYLASFLPIFHYWQHDGDKIYLKFSSFWYRYYLLKTGNTYVLSYTYIGIKRKLKQFNELRYGRN